MKTIILLLLFTSTASAQTWRFANVYPNTTIKHDEIVGGIRDGFEIYNHYFKVSFTEKPKQSWVDYYVIMYRHPLPGYGLAVADKPGHFGYGVRNAIYIDQTRNLVSRAQVRVVIAHELGHLFDAKHTADRKKDIMHVGGWPHIETFSRTDWNQIQRKLSPRSLRPWNDPNPPWVARETFPWTNPGNEHDVNDDGIVTSRDALNVLNAVGAGVKFDRHSKPKMYYDVNGDDLVSSRDALQVLNYLAASPPR